MSSTVNTWRTPHGGESHGLSEPLTFNNRWPWTNATIPRYLQDSSAIQISILLGYMVILGPSITSGTQWIPIFITQLNV